MGILKKNKKYTIDSVQVDCSQLRPEYIDNLFLAYFNNDCESWVDFDEAVPRHGYSYLSCSKISDKEGFYFHERELEGKIVISYSEFMVHFGRSVLIFGSGGLNLYDSVRKEILEEEKKKSREKEDLEIILEPYLKTLNLLLGGRIKAKAVFVGEGPTSLDDSFHDCSYCSIYIGDTVTSLGFAIKKNGTVAYYVIQDLENKVDIATDSLEDFVTHSYGLRYTLKKHLTR